MPHALTRSGTCRRHTWRYTSPRAPTTRTCARCGRREVWVPIGPSNKFPYWRRA